MWLPARRWSLTGPATPASPSIPQKRWGDPITAHGQKPCTHSQVCTVAAAARAQAVDVGRVRGVHASLILARALLARALGPCCVSPTSHSGRWLWPSRFFVVDTATPTFHRPSLPPQIEEARGEFDEIDTNSDGFIDREEIAAMPEAPEDEELEEFFDTYDVNKDGKVSFEEILEADASLLDEEEGEFEEAM